MSKVMLKVLEDEEAIAGEGRVPSINRRGIVGRAGIDMKGVLRCRGEPRWDRWDTVRGDKLGRQKGPKPSETLMFHVRNLNLN